MLIFPSVIVPVLSRHNVSTCANVSIEYISWTKIRFFASLVTPVVNAILINNTNPFGNIPSKAAAEATTDSWIDAFRMNKASKNKMIPKGMITKLVNLDTLRIDSTSSE